MLPSYFPPLRFFHGMEEDNNMYDLLNDYLDTLNVYKQSTSSDFSLISLIRKDYHKVLQSCRDHIAIACDQVSALINFLCSSRTLKVMRKIRQAELLYYMIILKAFDLFIARSPF